jgi:hypothetical protein
MFTIIEENGRVGSDNPKLDAFKQMAYLAGCGITYTLKVENNEYTIIGDGCMALTFYRRTE